MYGKCELHYVTAHLSGTDIQTAKRRGNLRELSVWQAVYVSPLLVSLTGVEGRYLVDVVVCRLFDIAVLREHVE